MDNQINQKEFALFQAFIYQHVGISMSDSKRSLVVGRLAKRLKHYGLTSYQDYYNVLHDGKYLEEKQIAINLLTTNETHFFREPKHFDLLRDLIFPNLKGKKFRVWSAASSSGEEVYTLAMIMAEHLPSNSWELLGSDISTSVLQKAKIGSYPILRADEIPKTYLQKYCLKGIGDALGTMLIVKELRNLVSFQTINLIEPLPDIGLFDAIFLRNVMIYFDLGTKQELIKRIVQKLKPGGYLFISHSESLNGVANELNLIKSSVYQKGF